MSPSPNGWAGGSRWFRCDVFEVSAVETDGDDTSDWRAQHTGTRDALKDPASPLAYGCLAAWGLLQLPSPATIEYAGTWTAPEVPFATLAGDRAGSTPPAGRWSPAT